MKRNYYIIILFFSLCLGVCGTFYSPTECSAAVVPGTVIDMNKIAFVEPDFIPDPTNVSVIDGSQINEINGTGLIMGSASDINNYYVRRYCDAANYFIYAFDIPSDAEHFYLNGLFRASNGAIYYSVDDKKSWTIFHRETAASADYREPNAVEIDLFDDSIIGGNPDCTVYVKFAAYNTSSGNGLQVYKGLNFSHDGTISDAVAGDTPTISQSDVKGFTNGINSLNDGDYLINASTETTTSIDGAACRNYSNSDGTYFVRPHIMSGNYGVYKFDLDLTSSAEALAFESVILKLEVGGCYRLSVASGITSAEAAEIDDSPEVWHDISCGYLDMPIAERTFSLSNFLDGQTGQKTIYIRLCDATRNSSGGALVGNISLSSVFKFIGKPTFNDADSIVGYVGYPVNLAVIRAFSMETYPAELSFAITDSDGNAVTANVGNTSFSTENAGNYTVIATATDANGNVNTKSVNAVVSPNPGALTGIELASRPDKTNYLFGEKPNFDGGEIALAFENGASYNIAMNDCASNVVSFDKIGEITITLTFGGKQTAFTADCADYLLNIVVRKFDTPIFYSDVQPDCSGFEFRAYYAGGTAAGSAFDYRDINTDDAALTIYGYNTAIIGKQTINVLYEGLKTSFEVVFERTEIIGAVIANLPEKTEYAVGEILSLDGGVINLLCNNGEIRTISMRDNSLIITGFDNTANQTCTVSLTYNGFAVGFDVKVGNGVYGNDKNGGMTWAIITSACGGVLLLCGAALIVIKRKKRV